MPRASPRRDAFVHSSGFPCLTLSLARPRFCCLPLGSWISFRILVCDTKPCGPRMKLSFPFFVLLVVFFQSRTGRTHRCPGLCTPPSLLRAIMLASRLLDHRVNSPLLCCFSVVVDHRWRCICGAVCPPAAVVGNAHQPGRRRRLERSALLRGSASPQGVGLQGGSEKHYIHTSTFPHPQVSSYSHKRRVHTGCLVIFGDSSLLSSCSLVHTMC